MDTKEELEKRYPNLKIKDDIILKQYDHIIHIIIFIIFAIFTFILINISGAMSSIEIIQIILAIWFFDTFSFLGGKIIGGKKLMPSISSGKTQSGLLVGITATLFSFYIYSII